MLNPFVSSVVLVPLVSSVRADAWSCGSLSFLRPLCRWADRVVSSMGLLQWRYWEHLGACLLVNSRPHSCGACTHLGEELLSPGVDVCLALADTVKGCQSGCASLHPHSV